MLIYYHPWLAICTAYLLQIIKLTRILIPNERFGSIKMKNEISTSIFLNFNMCMIIYMYMYDYMYIMDVWLYIYIYIFLISFMSWNIQTSLPEWWYILAFVNFYIPWHLLFKVSYFSCTVCNALGSYGWYSDIIYLSLCHVLEKYCRLNILSST